MNMKKHIIDFNLSKLVFGWMDGWMDVWMDESTGPSIDGWMDRSTDVGTESLSLYRSLKWVVYMKKQIRDYDLTILCLDR